MRIDVAFTPSEVRSVAGRRVVVIDVLRATSTIVHALVNGARSVLPVANVAEAAAKAAQLGRDAVLLCGERDCEPIRGFQLGNSPLEFTEQRVGGMPLVMTTTNGTGALLAAAGASRCYVGALLNVDAVAERLLADGEDALLLCAGREGAFALEDALCAGRILRRARALGARFRRNDAGLAAERMAGRPTAEAVLGRTAAGRRLRELGRDEDIAFCARENLYTVVPVLEEHRIRL